ncbi:MAG TPA: SulP family inorganic anion transporter, partial [Gaiellaceae bacterium]|nr:SulP family inorganic anion transporter [Gaiellaceae bacterium]
MSVAAVAIPASLGMAELAGLPVVVGLYATMLPLLGYAVFGSSRQLVVGPEGALAALTAVTLAPLAAGDPARYAALAAALAIVMSTVLLVGCLLRLGFMADFFSKPVLLGYVNGIALTIIASQLGKLFGVSVSEQDIFPILWELVRELGDVHGATLVLSVILLSLAVGLRLYAPKVPATLAVLAIAIFASELLDLAEDGVAVVGEVEGGLPSLGWPEVAIGDVVELLLPASAFALIAFADTIACARTYANKNGYEIDANRELAGLGGANLAAGISGVFPVSASGSRTALNDATGGRTQVTGLATAGVVAVIALFATSLIEPLPKAALGVVLVIAALALFDFTSIWRLRRVRADEVGLALVALFGVLVFGVLGGLAVAIGLSIAVFVYRTVRPHDAVLGKVHDVDGYHDVEGYDTAQTVPGLVVYRFDAPLFFANAEYFRQQVLALVAPEPKPSWLLVNAEAFVYLDSTAVDMLKQLGDDLRRRGVILGFARLKGRQREVFHETGLTAMIG